MYRNKKIYAVYRLLYGEDFIKESIESILEYVDKVFIFWSDYPFYKVKGVTYKGEYIKFPKRFDKSLEIINSIKSEKIILINEHFETNDNSFTEMYNFYILPDYDECNILMMIEVDHVFREDQLKLAIDEFIDTNKIAATTEQWEIWKGFKHCVPQWNDKKVEFEIPDWIKNYQDKSWSELYKIENPRKRMCTMFLNMDHYKILPKTGTHCNPVDINFLDKEHRLEARTHNFGFAKSYKIMKYAHLISLAVSSLIHDTKGYENWFEDKWVNWTPDLKNLEGSENYEFTIPKCVEYPFEELPESIKKIQMNIKYTE